MKLILDLDSPVERVRLPIFTPLFPIKHAFYQIRSIFFSFFLLLPSPSFVLPRGRRAYFTLFYPLACISLRIPWAIDMYNKDSKGTAAYKALAQEVLSRTNLSSVSHLNVPAGFADSLLLDASSIEEQGSEGGTEVTWEEVHVIV
jgi:hypothetical protein